MIVYLSGPMTGVKRQNRPAFQAAAAALGAAGFTVINPADQPPALAWQHYMRAALRSLAESDAVALLPGWASSKGATLEAQIASTLGIPVHLIADLMGELR